MAQSKRSNKKSQERIDEGLGKAIEGGALDNPQNDTEAGQSIAANPTDASKMALMNTAVDALSRMDKMDLSYLLQQVLDQVGHEADPVDDSQTAQNQQSIEPRDSALNAQTPNLTSMAKEELEEIFGDAELTEDTKEKLTTLFESAVNLKVKQVQARMEDEYEQQMNEEIRKVTDEIVEQIDEYLTYAAQEWLEENRIAVQGSLKTELTEDFIRGLKGLFSEHFIEIPDNEVSIVEKLSEDNEKLRDELEEETKTNMELTKELREHNRSLMIEKATYSMTLPEKERFKELAEELEYNDPEDFEKKLGHLTESVRKHRTTSKTKTELTEGIYGEDTSEEENPLKETETQGIRGDRMKAYRDALSRVSRSQYLGAGT